MHRPTLNTSVFDLKASSLQQIEIEVQQPDRLISPYYKELNFILRFNGSECFTTVINIIIINHHQTPNIRNQFQEGSPPIHLIVNRCSDLECTINLSKLCHKASPHPTTVPSQMYRKMIPQTTADAWPVTIPLTPNQSREMCNSMINSRNPKDRQMKSIRRQETVNHTQVTVSQRKFLCD
ncbi:hypothetical protein ACTXT7_001861 [Hymenolepis weldensis]